MASLNMHCPARLSDLGAILNHSRGIAPVGSIEEKPHLGHCTDIRPDPEPELAEEAV